MIALLETYTQKYSPYEKIKILFGGQENIEVFEENILGMKILRVRIALPPNASPKNTLKNYKKVMQILSRANTRRVCFKTDFPMRDEITQNNFTEPSDKMLWKMKASEIAKDVSLKGQRVFIAMGDAKRDISAANDLVDDYRYIMLSSKIYQGDFCRYMCEKTGVSIIEKPGEKEIIKADAALIFNSDEKMRLKRNCVVISEGKMPDNIEGSQRYVKDADFVYKGNLNFSVPEGFLTKDILSDAVTLGVCKSCDISTENINIGTIDDLTAPGNT